MAKRSMADRASPVSPSIPCSSTKFRTIYKMQSSGTFQPEKLVGRRATVYVSVPEKRSGRGKITLNAQGKFMELDAMTDGERLSVDDPVEIVATENECMLVARAAENDEEKEVK